MRIVGGLLSVVRRVIAVYVLTMFGEWSVDKKMYAELGFELQTIDAVSKWINKKSGEANDEILEKC